MLVPALALLFTASAAFAASNIPLANAQPFADVLKARQNVDVANAHTLRVDLGYEIYEGYTDTGHNQDVWRGIRYAAPPIGSLRWQPPQAPALNRSGSAIAATKNPGQCPQQSSASPGFNPYTTPHSAASEDCLFLNVFKPKGKKNLPVMVWIHGGGYGGGNAAGYDATNLIAGAGNDFLAVIIQYRLGSFGFLASDEVYRRGVVNAGLLDQHFALQWVQAYIESFGGNASDVTIAGESAGGGSVMLQDMAYGGTLGTSLFRQTWAASPYLPQQYAYNDWIPSQAYYAFAAAANCSNSKPYGYNQSSQTIFDCLVAAPTEVLQQAGWVTSASGPLYEWVFLPVTDGEFVQTRPSVQLLEGKLNGVNLLVGNNADEGALFVPQTITTDSALLSYLQVLLPSAPSSILSQILSLYPGPSTPDSPSTANYATNGLTPPYATNQSALATGHQQRANAIYAESTFVCPSYWLAEAYSGNTATGEERAAYKYQYSVVGATHGTDLSAYGMHYATPQPSQAAAFVLAFQRLIGNFIAKHDPSVSAHVANGNTSSHPNAASAATDWPVYTLAAPYMINLNESGGVPYVTNFRSPVNLTALEGSGLRNNITVVDAYSWEGGRGMRCDFWRSIGAVVPE